jgi:outer membrane protein assembly factor BamB
MRRLQNQQERKAMLHRFGWLWVAIVLPFCVAAVAVGGIVAADLLGSADSPLPEQTPTAKKQLPPCCCLDGCVLPDHRLPQAASGQPKAALPQATFGGTIDRNMVNLVDKNVPTTWSVADGKLKNIKWVAEVGTRSYGGPVIYGGRVFVGTNNDQPRDPKIKETKAVLMCFRESDGAFLYQILHDLPGQEIIREAVHDGLCSTPTAQGDFIYYCTPGCEVICAHAKDGKIAWSFDMMKKLKVFPCYLCNCSPLVVGDLLFVMTGNGTDNQGDLVSPKAPSFVALRKATGEVVWTSALPGRNIIEGQWANPVYAEANGKPQVIFPGGDGYLYALDPANGNLIWKFNCSPKVDSDREIKSYFVATPVVYQNKVYIGTGAYPDHPSPPRVGHFFCIDITKTGDVSCKDDKYDPKAPANKGSALVWHFGGLIQPKPAKGRIEYFGRTISTAAIHDGLVYIAEERGYLHCLDAATGKAYWEHDFRTGIWGSPYWVDGKIYLCTEDGDVHIFAHGKVLKKIGSVDMDESLQTTPVVVNGVLYIATKKKVYAIRAAK